MKKLIKSAAFLLMAAPLSSVLADSGPGCGLGQQIFKGQSGLFAHTAAATTNGTFWNQWFGLSSGTLGCDGNSVVDNEYQRKVFVANNLDNIAQDMAQGQGDHLASLASLMGVSKTDEPVFFAMTQTHYGKLVSAGDTTATQFLSALDNAMVSDPVLAKYVR
jgi:hypothetical protein